MAARSSRILGMRVPIDEYEALRALADAEHRTVGGLALDLMRSGRTTQGMSAIEQFSAGFCFQRSIQAE